MKLRIAAVLLACAALVSAASDTDKRLQKAAKALKEVMDIPDKSIPQDLLNKAECIVIVPDLKKAAFVVGGKYGKVETNTRRRQAAQGYAGRGRQTLNDLPAR